MKTLFVSSNIEVNLHLLTEPIESVPCTHTCILLIMLSVMLWSMFVV